jgi:hypothetical protein
MARYDSGEGDLIRLLATPLGSTSCFANLREQRRRCAGLAIQGRIALGPRAGHAGNKIRIGPLIALVAFGPFYAAITW